MPSPTVPGLQVISALRQLFGQLIDPRRPRGVRHKLASVLTITVLTALAGAGNFRQAGDQAADLPETLLAAAGARISPRTGQREPPSAATIRRVVEGIDAAHADALVGRWLAACVAAARAQTATTGEAVCDRELPEGWTGSTGWPSTARLLNGAQDEYERVGLRR
jgi:hypothetical protein